MRILKKEKPEGFSFLLYIKLLHILQTDAGKLAVGKIISAAAVDVDILRMMKDGELLPARTHLLHIGALFLIGAAVRLRILVWTKQETGVCPTIIWQSVIGGMGSL